MVWETQSSLRERIPLPRPLSPLIRLLKPDFYYHYLKSQMSKKDSLYSCVVGVWVYIHNWRYAQYVNSAESATSWLHIGSSFMFPALFVHTLECHKRDACLSVYILIYHIWISIWMWAKDWCLSFPEIWKCQQIDTIPTNWQDLIKIHLLLFEISCWQKGHKANKTLSPMVEVIIQYKIYVHNSVHRRFSAVFHFMYFTILSNQGYFNVRTPKY